MPNFEKKGAVQLVVMGNNEMVVKLDATQEGNAGVQKIIIRQMEKVDSGTRPTGLCCDGLCCNGLKSASQIVRVMIEETHMPVIEQVHMREEKNKS